MSQNWVLEIHVDVYYFPLCKKKKLGKFSSIPKPHMTSWPLLSWKEMVSFNADDLKWSCQLWNMFGLYNHPIWVPIEFHFGYLTRPWKVWQRGVVCQQTLGFNDVTNEHGGSKSKRDWTNNLGFTHQQNEEFLTTQSRWFREIQQTKCGI